MALVDGSAELYARGEIGQNSVDFLARFEAAQNSVDLLGKMTIRHSTSLNLKFILYVRPEESTAVELLVGGRDRRMEIK